MRPPQPPQLDTDRARCGRAEVLAPPRSQGTRVTCCRQIWSETRHSAGAAPCSAEKFPDNPFRCHNQSRSLKRGIGPWQRFPKSISIFSSRKKAFATLATTMSDGSPQVTPVWFDYKDGIVRVNTAKGRVKARNLKEGAAVALAIIDPDNPYRYIQLRGRVAARLRSGRGLRTSIRSRRNISGRTSTPLRLPARCG